MPTFLRRSRRALLLVLAAAIAAVALTSTAAGAATVHHKPKKKPVPTCTSLGHVRPGVQAWMDTAQTSAQGLRSPLFVNTDKLICSAADRSRIEIKSWFVTGKGATVTRLATHLRLMHRYHHVSVVILVGRNGYRGAGGPAAWRLFVNRFRGIASIRSCTGRCTTPFPGGISHSKFVTVSKMRSGGPAVLSTSANFTDQQFGTVESGIFVAGDQGLYNAFHGRFVAMAAHTARPTTTGWVAHARGVAAYFSPTPSAIDPDRLELSRVACRHGGRIRISSLRISNGGVINELARLRRQGCSVAVIIEHTSPYLSGTGLTRRCAYQHDKSIVVDTPALKEVIAGSEDFAWGALHSNDQQMLRVHSRAMVAAFERQFAVVWRHPTACLAP